MDELMEILEDLRPDVDFENETALIDDGVLDSFDIVALVGELNEAFDIEIKPNNLVPENFNSAKAMMALIEQLQDE
ncbi:phosphopantetheine-binding protein [Ruminococcus sp.]|uniref:phosphopantetheine-binding protein n=1 Tax=Ruminococcus sp. TaxID=41978 RepID=UPI00263717B3|nr:phosphopantetheine-binding protein [Ruminococcus sp.]MDD6988261.1 phosphopantetheine-binding protein [Ruminococcus sp.]MDY6201111.1 phosphopantetheine-binding protein [Ruminococcus sp.]